jgi:hypothetical protein
MKLCQCNIPGQFPVNLRRESDGTLFVVYGLQVEECDSMSEALERFQSCVRHAMECEGMLDVDEND